jgi:hypothetical protein
MAKIKNVLDAVLKYSPMRAKLAPDDLVDGDTVKITCTKGTVALIRCWKKDKDSGKDHVEDADS